MNWTHLSSVEINCAGVSKQERGSDGRYRSAAELGSGTDGGAGAVSLAMSAAQSRGQLWLRGGGGGGGGGGGYRPAGQSLSAALFGRRVRAGIGLCDVAAAESADRATVAVRASGAAKAGYCRRK